MQNHTFTLEPYGTGKGTRHTCPSCGTKKQFARYINIDTNEYLADHVGRCNSETSCGYHSSPRDFFEANPDQKQAPARERKPEPKKKPSFIDPDFVASRFTGFKSNTFVQYLISLFGPAITRRLISEYEIGTCNERWPGAAIFWIKDQEGRTRAGQVKHFETNGHTGSYTDKDGGKQSKTGWVHKHLEFKYGRKTNTEKKPAWLTTYLENPECWPCLFGEHLLSVYPSKPVAIVEAPKTAIIASICFPDFVWLAVGSKSNFSTNNPRRLAAIKGRSVCLFPDLKAFDEWSLKAGKLSYLANFHTSDFLETNATEKEKAGGLDLADYLVRFPYTDFAPEEKAEPKEPDPPTACEPAPVLAPFSQKQAENTPAKPERVGLYKAQETKRWDLVELETFFATTPPPAGPVQLYPWAAITNPALFIQSHLVYLKANNVHRAALPHLERLQRLKSILEGTAFENNPPTLLHSAA